MLQQTHFITVPADKALTDYFTAAGDRLEEEAQVFGSTVQRIMADGQHINNKNIISSLIKTLETTDDVIQADVLRNTLEIVVNHTLDDI